MASDLFAPVTIPALRREGTFVEAWARFFLKLVARVLGDWADVAGTDVVFAATGSMTITGVAGDVSYYRYSRMGNLVYIKASILGVTLGGTPSTEWSIAMPAGLTLGPTDTVGGVAIVTDDNFVTQQLGSVISRAASNTIGFKKGDGSVWANGTDTASVVFSGWFEVVT